MPARKGGDKAAQQGEPCKVLRNPKRKDQIEQQGPQHEGHQHELRGEGRNAIEDVLEHHAKFLGVEILRCAG